MTAFEKFPDDQLHLLRVELLRSGLDSFQVGELLAAFLTQHGYGVSADAARTAAVRIEAAGCAIGSLEAELEKLAYVM